ncbi:histidine racemase CntK [Staphylococcus pseudintermedius]|uniref:histidine racemase CntK n=1 Tax=Staphylococcus pseudintermedius TaxID=283734 RepID=UPI0021528F63|nr:histidine racemase CntK [Staphylococcus pseudintermedius]MDE9803676.1 histidine racemase CntK [Staphylococcus pseudintermedius]MDK4143381.1 histidine racemase CntK [Staphylococcus pseudintermedius]WMZ53219.1 histidine racemase CntK [Staphylococcus pseudintermedius]
MIFILKGDGIKLEIVHFSKFNPSGNMTVLVDSQHDPSQYRHIAQQLMKSSHVGCEQVGFIVDDEGELPHQLVMSGQEFCGNGTLSFIRYLKDRNLLTTSSFKLKVSGMDTPVHCAIHETPQQFETTLPQPKKILERQYKIDDVLFEGLEIQYDTYQHFVFPITVWSEKLVSSIESFVRAEEWPEHLTAVGLMLYDTLHQRLYPLIYVPQIDSIIWEQSCGSGTGSVGVYEAYQNQLEHLEKEIVQPGGALTAIVDHNDEGYQVAIKGNVSTVATGLAYIE